MKIFSANRTVSISVIIPIYRLFECSEFHGFRFLSFIGFISAIGIYYSKQSEHYSNIFEAFSNNLIYCIFLLVFQLTSLGIIIAFTIKYSDVGSMKEDKAEKWERLSNTGKLV